MADAGARDEWVLRVLGVDVSGAAQDAFEAPDAFEATDAFEALDEVDEAPIDPLAVWTDAKDKVDAGLNALTSVLQKHQSPILQRIGAVGLYSLTEGRNMALTKALREYKGAPAARREAATADLRSAASSYRSFLDGSDAVGLIDDNVFGIDVGLLDTLGGALAKIEKSLA